MTSQDDVRKRLRQLIDLDFEKTSLDNVLKYISEVQKGLNIVIDPDVSTAGVDLATRVVDLKVKSAAIEWVLSLILGADLAYKVQPGYVLITTREKLQQNLEMHSYPVQDLVCGTDASGTHRAEPDAMLPWEQLVDVVQRTVNNLSDPNVAAWFDEGGPASIEYLGGVLVVTQTDNGHQRLGTLLHALRTGNEPGTQIPTGDPMTHPTTVFIVHGRNLTPATEIARFLEKLGLIAVILHEHPRAGATLIESVERVACHVDFAVVVLTPDDVGALKSEIDAAQDNSEKVAKLKPRARQNVILELGYFLGRLSRQRVCVLRKGGLEIVADLSDMHGVLCHEMDDSGAWQQKVASVLKDAGFPVDFNRLLG